MAVQRVITFTTDFGTSDSYVAQMKGVVLGIAPDCRPVDLCHEVPAQDIATGAYLLETGYAAFPAGTIHVAVVDPGVGTARKALAVRTADYFFVAPDNGLLTRVLRREKLIEARYLEEARFQLSPASPTFAGRDIFAPAAAWLARGSALEEFGPTAPELAELEYEEPELRVGRPVAVRVIAVDHFGNVILELTAEALKKVLSHAPDERSSLALEAPGGRVTQFHRTYGAAGREPFLLINSSGYLEIALAGGRADRHLRLQPGLQVRLTVGT